MRFQAAFGLMKTGKAISLPEWGGYWCWDDDAKTIRMHLRTGEVMDMRDSPDMDFTISHTFRDDWLVLEDTSVTEHIQHSTN